VLSGSYSGARFGATDESAVKALLESAKLRLYDAFSAQMAHWSSDRPQYGPFVSMGNGSSSLCGGMGKRLLRKGRSEVRDISFACAARRANRRRRVRVFISGRMKIRNSWPPVGISEAS
jgi:hypothetical protein